MKIEKMHWDKHSHKSLMNAGFRVNKIRVITIVVHFIIIRVKSLNYNRSFYNSTLLLNKILLILGYAAASFSIFVESNHLIVFFARSLRLNLHCLLVYSYYSFIVVSFCCSFECREKAVFRIK